MGRPDFEEDWKDRFRKFAVSKDDDAGIAGWSPSGLRARVRRFQQLWRPAALDVVWLDAGCGAGTYSRLLTTHGAKVVGLDYSIPSLHKARHRDQGGVTYVAADVNHLPFQSGSVGGVLCFGVTQALQDTEPAISELARVLESGGALWIDALNAWCLPHLWERVSRHLAGRPPHLRYESASSVQRFMLQSGFLDVRVFWLPILPSRIEGFQRLLETRFMRWLFEVVPGLGALLSHSFLVLGVQPQQEQNSW